MRATHPTLSFAALALGATLALTGLSAAQAPVSTAQAPVPVTLDTFIRAETDTYFAKYASDGALGMFRHTRGMTPIDKQNVVRMNRDTLYSSAVFDLGAGPVTITLPEAGTRFMSLQVVSQDHYTTEVVYAPGTFTYSKDTVGTRYVFCILRTLANPEDAADLKAAHVLQDAVRVVQASRGTFEVPAWDQASLAQVRSALEALGRFEGKGARFGRRDEVDPVAHLVGTAIGWGGNPPEAAYYAGVVPARNDGATVHTLKVKDVPVDGFWSISLYNARGFFEKNARGAYSINDITANKGADGSVTVQFGGCEATTANCLPITPGWNYTVRLYRARPEVVNGSWTFPVAVPKG